MSTTTLLESKPVPVLRRSPVPGSRCKCGGLITAGGECQQCRGRRLGLQRSALSTGPALAPPSVHRVLASPGRPLDAETRAFMEPRFRHSFADVRVHADGQAADSARAVGARAYAVGRRVVFAGGAYAPDTAAGRRLLAHELAHVVQQRGASAALQPSLEVGAENDPAEREADRAAAAVLRGDPAPRLSRGGSVRLSRQEATETRPGAESSEQSGVRASGSAEEEAGQVTGICLRTPLPPGQVRFTGCSATQLARYRVLPESGTSALTPVNGTWFDSDGVWDSQRANPREWFKVPSHCDATLTCTEGGFHVESCCNGVASLIKGTPRWTTDPHGAVPPP